MYQMLDSDKGWEFSTIILKARVIAEIDHHIPQLRAYIL